MAARINAEHHRAPRTHNHCKVQNHSVCNKVCLFAVCAVVVARQTDRQTGRQVRLLLLVCACAVVRQLRAWLVVGCTHSRCLHVHMEWLVVCLCVDLAQGSSSKTGQAQPAPRMHKRTNATTRAPSVIRLCVAVQCTHSSTRHRCVHSTQAHTHTRNTQCCTSVQLCPSHTHHNVASIHPSIHVTHTTQHAQHHTQHSLTTHIMHHACTTTHNSRRSHSFAHRCAVC